MADAARQPLEEPHVAHRCRERDVAQPLAADLGLRDLDAALVADDAAVLHALVLAAEALPVGDRSEDLRAEEAVTLRLERPVVDRLRLGDFPVRPLKDALGRRETDANRVEVGRELTFIVNVWSHRCPSRYLRRRVRLQPGLSGRAKARPYEPTFTPSSVDGTVTASSAAGASTAGRGFVFINSTSRHSA